MKILQAEKRAGSQPQILCFFLFMFLLTANLFPKPLAKDCLLTNKIDLEKSGAVPCTPPVLEDQNLASILPSFPYYAPNCVPASAWAGVAFDAPRFFPIPSFQMVVGTREKPCTYLPDCDAFSRGELEWPEGFVMEVLIATLGDCMARKCHVLDFGGNMGYVNSYAAALGAKVVSVEPQADLALANKRTIEHNCWNHRVTNLDGLVTLKQAEHNQDVEVSNLWRPGMVDFKKTRNAKKLFLGSIADMLETKNIELVKIDVDSIDIPILKFLADYVEEGKIIVQSFLIETACSGEVFYQLQKLGYAIYQLDHHLRMRFFNAQGLDVYKYRGSPIPFLAGIGEEFQCRRGMRMLVKMPTLNSTEAFQQHCKKIDDAPVRTNFLPFTIASFFITKEELLQPNVMESWSKGMPPVTKGVYKNEKMGMPGEVVNPDPMCSVSQV